MVVHMLNKFTYLMTLSFQKKTGVLKIFCNSSVYHKMRTNNNIELVFKIVICYLKKNK